MVPAIGKGVLAALQPWAAPETHGQLPGRGLRARARWPPAYPPEMLERLRAVKHAVDPTGVFTFGHAI